MVSKATYEMCPLFSIVHNAEYSECAEKVDRQCLNTFVQNMKTKPDLCTNIPFKYNCLKEGMEASACNAGILKNLLNVFPEEVNKVLKVFCPPKALKR